MSDINYASTTISGVQGIAPDGQAILLTDRDKLVEFYEKEAPDSTALQKKVVVMCKIMNPGEPLNVWDQPVRHSDKRRFPQQWAAFEAGFKQRIDGTPLRELFPGNVGAVRGLEAVNVFTVEHLANLSDTATQELQFGHDLRVKAQHFMKVKVLKDNQEKERIAAAQAEAVQGMAMKMEALTAQMNAQAAELEAFKNRPKPGRPKKVQPPEQPAA